MSPQKSKKLVLRAMDDLIGLDRAGAINPGFKAQIIMLARKYSQDNGLPYDNSFVGAMRLAEHAERICTDQDAKEQREDRRRLEAIRRGIHPNLRGSTRVKDLIQ